MNDKDKHFIERYEELLDKGYCDCNEMNCIDNNSPRRILNIVKQLQSNWNSLREWLEKQISNDLDGIFSYSGRQCKETLDKMNELEGVDNNVEDLKKKDYR